MKYYTVAPGQNGGIERLETLLGDGLFEPESWINAQETPDFVEDELVPMNGIEATGQGQALRHPTEGVEGSTSPAYFLEMGHWRAIWSPPHNMYYFYNVVTTESTWSNPLLSLSYTATAQQVSSQGGPT